MRVRLRRTAIVVMAALVASVGLAACAHRQPKATGPSDLPTLAQQRGIAVGTEFVQNRFDSGYYREMTTDNFTSITPNRSFKWAYLEPRQGQFDFSDSDKIVDFATTNHLRVRGCCLAWDVANPAWLTSRSWTKPQLKQVLHDYITRVVGRYAGRVAQWDVVNEALYSTSGTPQGPYNVTGDPRNLWGEVIGPEYIADAFLWAHEADPSAQLFYNDYGAESPSPKFDAELRLVKALKAHGVPITGVGLQTHRPVPRNPPYYPTEPQVTKVMKSLAAIGLHSEITELDQQLPLPARPAMLQLQGTLYQQMVTACLSVALCTGVTVWGLDDSDRYQQLKANNTGAATLFGTNGQVKPSFRGVVRALLNAPGPAKADRASPGPAP